MSKDNLFNIDEQRETQDPGLVDEISDYVSTDIITDLKTGIYNLFLSMIDHLIVTHGPVEAVNISTSFLDEISNTFKKTTE
jgi:hypothetical protein